MRVVCASPNAIIILFVGGLVAGFPSRGQGQSLFDVLVPTDGARRPTLMQWSYGNSFTGGPDLDEPMMTDRPDFTEASSTVGRRVLQIENGYTYAYNNDGSGQVIRHSYPESLFRYGILTDWLELRFAINFAALTDDAHRTSGKEDIYVGIKLGLTPQEGILPEMAIVPQMTIPSGADELTADETLPGVNWLYGWDINDSLSTAGSTQVNRANEGSTLHAYTEWAQSWTVGYTLTEKLGAYTECFGLFPQSALLKKPQYYFNGGFTYRFTKDIQWDMRHGVGLNEAADDYFSGMGLSFRFH